MYFSTLVHSKADKLVAIFQNLRILRKMTARVYVDTVVGWNDDDNETGLVQSINGLVMRK